MSQISSDPAVQDAIMNSAEELLKKEDYKQAFEIFVDIFQYDGIRERYEVKIMTAIAYCLTFEFKDYAKAKEML